MENRCKAHRKTKESKLKYKSELEARVHKVLDFCDYEPFWKEYTLHKKYRPDFVPKNNDKIWFESKGRFKDYAECQKYIGVKNSYPDVRIVFIFQNPKAKAYAQCKRRKDGTYMSLSEWAELNKFEYTSEKDLTKFLEMFYV